MLVRGPSPEAQRAVVWWHDGPPVVGLAGREAFYWDSDASSSGQVVALSIEDGSRLSSREIDGLDINGEPGSWRPAPDGFVAVWDAPSLVAEREGALSIRWRAPDGRWSTGVPAGDLLVFWQAPPGDLVDSAIVALDPRDGSELWRSPLDPAANGVELRALGERVFVVWQQYSPSAPTPTITIPQRVRALELGTGRALWTRDFREHTGGIVAAGDSLVVAVGADLRFIDGVTGRVIREVPTGHDPNVYPSFAAAGSTVFVALWDAVTAYEATTGVELWRHAIRLDGGPELAVQGDLLLVTTEHGTLAAIDRLDGTRRWEVMTGVSASSILGNDQGVVVVGGGRSAGLALPARLDPERATLRGRVETRCREPSTVRLEVGDQRVTPEPDGSYETTFDFAGDVVVSAPGAAPSTPNSPAAAVIHLTGRGAYEVPTLTLDYCERPLPPARER